MSAEILLRPLIHLSNRPLSPAGLLAVTSQQNSFAFSRPGVQKNMFHFNGLCIFKQNLSNSCTKCKSLQLYLFFSYLESHLCPAVQFSGFRHRREGEGAGAEKPSVQCCIMHRVLCVWVWALIHSRPTCKCAVCSSVHSAVSVFFCLLVFIGPFALRKRIISKSLHVTAPHVTTKNQLAQSMSPISCINKASTNQKVPLYLAILSVVCLFVHHFVPHWQTYWVAANCSRLSLLAVQRAVQTRSTGTRGALVIQP